MKAPRRKFVHSLLIMEDFGQQGFEADDNHSLPIFKTSAALRELAKFHGTTWAFGEVTGNSLGSLWPFLLRPRSRHYLVVSKNSQQFSKINQTFNNF